LDERPGLGCNPSLHGRRPFGRSPPLVSSALIVDHQGSSPLGQEPGWGASKAFELSTRPSSFPGKPLVAHITRSQRKHAPKRASSAEPSAVAQPEWVPVEVPDGRWVLPGQLTRRVSSWHPAPGSSTPPFAKYRAFWIRGHRPAAVALNQRSSRTAGPAPHPELPDPESRSQSCHD
jgi:hypothetical protein